MDQRTHNVLMNDSSHKKWLSAGCAISLALLISELTAGAHAASNVLFLVIDDLRPELNCYGSNHIQSPNIDAFAKTAMRFDRAYCQQAVCNPSRSSLMTGLRPETIEVTGNHVHFREALPDVVTLPQHFKNNGYHAQAIGKIYHGFLPEGSSKTVWDTIGDSPSWSVPATRFGPRYYYTEAGMRDAKEAYIKMYAPSNPGPMDWTQKLVFGPMTEAPPVNDDVLFDGKVATSAIAALRERAERPDEPFFLAVGFIKPHTPFVAPKRYWDLYDASEIELAVDTTLPTDAPRFAGHRSGELRRYTDQPKSGPFSEENQRHLKHGYYACISYVDAQVGRVLNELDRLGLRESTIVVLFSDHGWHLGEHGLWGKTTNYERDARVPLIVRAPGMTSQGRETPALVELIDLYPSLSELAGITIPTYLQGRSFVPLLRDPDLDWKPEVLTQFPRGGNADEGGTNMGYSLRTERWRYIEWVKRATGAVIARELYDEQQDSNETVNLAGDSEYSKICEDLSARLRTIRENDKLVSKEVQR